MGCLRRRRVPAFVGGAVLVAPIPMMVLAATGGVAAIALVGIVAILTPAASALFDRRGGSTAAVSVTVPLCC